MAEAAMVMKDSIYFAWFALFIFFCGFCFSWPVDRFNITAFKWFPAWFMKVLSRYVNPKAGFMKIFIIIFLFNSISIGLYMVSGLFVIFPYIIAFLTGMNIGSTVFMAPRPAMENIEITDGQGASRIFMIMLFSTFVMALEVIVFSLALGMGMSLGVSMAAISNANPSASQGASMFLAELLALRIRAYMLICVPALALSAFMEASVIKGA